MNKNGNLGSTAGINRAKHDRAGTVLIEHTKKSFWILFLRPLLGIMALASLFLSLITVLNFSFSGYNLIFGKSLGYGIKIGGHWAGLLLLLFIILTVGLSFWYNSVSCKAVVVITILSLTLLSFLPMLINRYIADQLGFWSRFIEVELKLGPGIFILFVIFILIGAVNYVLAKQLK